MSKQRKCRYGWTKEEWLSYKGWALLYSIRIHALAAERQARIDLIALGAYAINED